MIKIFGALLGVLIVVGGGWYVFAPKPSTPAVLITQAQNSDNTTEAQTSNQTPTVENMGAKPVSSAPSTGSSVASSSANTAVATPPSTVPTDAHVYTQAELLAMADNKYADGSVPLGDYKYVTDAAKKGYIYLCNVHQDNPGSM